MSTQPVRRVPASRLALEFPQSLAVFDSYEEAQKAVDYLSDHEFPVENVLIVGTDLKQIERVTGRLTRGRVMVGGAMSGAWLGAFVAVVFDLIDEKGAGGWYLFGTVAPFPELEQTIAEVRERMVRPWRRTIAEVTGCPPATAAVLAQMLVAISRATVQHWIDGAIDRAGALDALMRGTTAIIAELTVHGPGTRKP